MVFRWRADPRKLALPSPEEALPAERIPWEVDDEAPAEKDFDDWIAVLRGGDPDACEEAVDALSDMGPPILPRLKALLDDDNPDLVVDVKKAIKLIEDTLA